MATTSLNFLPREALVKAAEQSQRLVKKVASMREEGEKVAGMAIQTAEIGGTALACGYMHYRYGKDGEYGMGGVPVDLAIGVLGMVGGFVAGKHGEHFTNAANGALSCYAARLGMKLGAEALTKANAPPGQLGAGGAGFAGGNVANFAAQAQARR